MKQALLFYTYYRWEDRGFGRINNFPQTTQLVNGWDRIQMVVCLQCPWPSRWAVLPLLPASRMCSFPYSLPRPGISFFPFTTMDPITDRLPKPKSNFLTFPNVPLAKNNWSSSGRIRGKLGLPTLCSYLQSSSSFSSGIKCAEGIVELKWEGMGEEGK